MARPLEALTGLDTVALKWPFCGNWRKEFGLPTEDEYWNPRVWKIQKKAHPPRCRHQTFGLGHPPGWGKGEENLESDCVVCRFLTAILYSFPRVEHKDEDDELLWYDRSKDTSIPHSFDGVTFENFVDTFAGFEDGQSRLHLRIRKDIKTPSVGFDLYLCERESETLPDAPGDTGSSRTMAWLRNRLDECDTSSEHGNCGHQSMSLPPILPSRVVEIIGPNTVRLHVTERGERGLYICLSHSWGGKQPITTIKATLGQSQAGIPWDALPKTFRDTITVVYNLGLRYLWIDSLCILQDDLEDWRQEGSKMANIYQSSYLTISATSSCDSSKGLFSHIGPQNDFRSVTFQDSDRKILVRPRMKNHLWEPLSQTKLPDRSVEFPLMARAWVSSSIVRTICG
jgi:hypothetical protein